MIEVEIDDRKLRQRIAGSPEMAKDFLTAMSEQITSEWKLDMQSTSKGGAGVKRTKSGKRHYHSLPGHPPAIDYGNLINSLHSENVVRESGDDTIGTPRGPQITEREVEFYGAHYGLILDQEKDRPFVEDGMKRVLDRDTENIAKAIWGE